MRRPKLAAFSHYCPRLLTLLVLASVAATIVLANLSHEFDSRKFDPATFRFPPPQSELEFYLGEPFAFGRSYPVLTNMSYGWPLLWRQYVIGSALGAKRVLGENYSASRLAANAAMWLAMLVIPAGICEWLLRRYRPRLRFSLRSMLVAVTLAAALCGWFIAAREQANLQDSLIVAFDAQRARLWVERRGPKWLDLFGAERYRRHIVGAELEIVADNGDDRESESLLEQLAQMPDLQYLSLETFRLTARRIEALSELRRLETLWLGVSELTGDSGGAMGGALRGMRRLRALTISPGTYGISDADEGMPHECLAAIGAMERIEHLRIDGRTIARADLGLLAGMRNLKSLEFHGISNESDQRATDTPLLADFPLLPQLEVLDLSGSDVGDDDLRYLAALPKLRKLNLALTNVTGDGLAKLARSETLQELAIAIVGDAASAAGLESLKTIKNLKRLRIQGIDAEGLQSGVLGDRVWHLPDDEFDDWLRALGALQKAKPGLLLDGDLKAFGFPSKRIPSNWESPDKSFVALAREAVRAWKEQQAATATKQNVVNSPTSVGGLGN